MIWNICSKYSTVVIIFYAIVISIDIINESTSILGHPCGTIDHQYKRVSIHNIKKCFSGGMLVMFKEVKIEISHDVTRILGHFLQYRMHCVIEIHNVAIWRAIYNTSYVCLTIKMNFCKYTFNMIINYIKFREMSVNFSAIYKDTPPPLPNNLVNPTCLYPFIPYLSNENGDSHVSERPITAKQRLILLI